MPDIVINYVHNNVWKIPHFEMFSKAINQLLWWWSIGKKNLNKPVSWLVRVTQVTPSNKRSCTHWPGHHFNPADSRSPAALPASGVPETRTLASGGNVYGMRWAPFPSITRIFGEAPVEPFRIGPSEKAVRSSLTAVTAIDSIIGQNTPSPSLLPILWICGMACYVICERHVQILITRLHEAF